MCQVEQGCCTDLVMLQNAPPYQRLSRDLLMAVYGAFNEKLAKPSTGAFEQSKPGIDRVSFELVSSEDRRIERRTATFVSIKHSLTTVEKQAIFVEVGESGDMFYKIAVSLNRVRFTADDIAFRVAVQFGRQGRGYLTQGTIPRISIVWLTFAPDRARPR